MTGKKKHKYANIKLNHGMKATFFTATFTCWSRLLTHCCLFVCYADQTNHKHRSGSRISKTLPMYVKCSSTLNMDSLVKCGCIGLLVVMLWFCYILITDVSFLITAVKYLWPLFPSGISTFLKTASNTRGSI